MADQKPNARQGPAPTADPGTTGAPLLEVRDLAKLFPLRRTLLQALRRERRWVHAVDGVSFEVRNREILGVVGESGCGKTTMGKLVMKLHRQTGGRMFFEGRDVSALSGNGLARYRRQVQMIFQDPYASMNPRFRVRDVLEEPLLIHRIGAGREERARMVRDALTAVKLTPVDDFLGRFPHMLSGGQRQRVATARALILSPRLLVADEPVSMIDLSTRAEILSVMKEIQGRFGVSYLYITHDLSTAGYFTDRIAVMYLGRIVEVGSSRDIVEHPVHPYTRALISAVCEPVPGRVRTIREVPIKGDIPSAADVPRGCRFHPRCPFARPACRELPEPELEPVERDHGVACRRWKEI